MRTGIDYFRLLSDSEKVKLQTNYVAFKPNRSFDGYLNKDFLSMAHFIDGAFHWGSTAEGYDFWLDVATKYNLAEIDALSRNQETRRLKIACAVMAVGYVVTLSIFIYHLVTKA